VIKKLYSQSQFIVCSKNLLAVEAVPNESITLRTPKLCSHWEPVRFFLSILVPKNVIVSYVFGVEKKYDAALNAIVALHVQINK